MRFTLFLIITLNFFSFHLNAQNISVDKRAKTVKSLYTHYSDLFKKKDFAFKKTDFNEEQYFFPTINKNKVKEYLAYINKSLKLEVNKNSSTDGFSDLKLTVNLPDFYKDLNYKHTHLFHKQISVENIFSDLVDEFNNPIKLSYTHRDYSSKKIIYTQLFTKDNTRKTINVKGIIKYEIKFLTNYNKIEITLKQIGSTFTLGKSTYKLIDCFNNHFIIKKLSGPPQESVYIVNLTANDQLIKQYSYSEFKLLKKNDSSYINKENFYNIPISGTPYFLYDIFKKEPKISLEKFDKLMTSEKFKELKEKDFSKRIIMLPIVSDLNSKYIFYTPQYKTEIIEIKK